MSSKWPRISVSQLQAESKLLVEDGNHGEYRPRPDEFADRGVSFIRAADMSDGQVLFSSAQCINEVACLRIRKGIGKPGDVLLSHKGTVGKVAFAPKDCPAFVCSPQTTFWRVMDERILDRSFLFAYLQSAEFKAQLASRKGETDMADYVSLTAQRQLLLPVPDILTQRKIGGFFSAFNDRIILLRETNATLEDIAQALFKSWFVDFDPVRAKAEGLDPDGMDAATAAQFPDSFEESELGVVPVGWKAMSFTETIDVIGGGTPRTSISDYWNGDIPWFSVVDAPTATDVFVIDTEKHITIAGLNNSSTKLLAAGTTIISARGTVGRLALVGREMAMNQSCYGLRGRAGDAYFTYFNTYRLVESLKQRAHGSVFDTITRDTMAGVSIIYPDEQIICEFESAVSPVMEKIKENLKQTQTLTQLRDTLLPRLISGQLCLPEVEASIENMLSEAV
ncbi:restriction endonuclease subunit S [Pseudomonas serbica]|jgi:type I restriction enzyme S subunit|uniref:restriction endonuclease subunit S n=1 Tax=Pseudomonas serbica TaxID=2965074 RepID=UPI00237AE1D3|nr:restriction endonuclease subunit S [Pseudomonas serbica]